MTDSPQIIPFDPVQHGYLISSIVSLHVQCIQFDGALLRFRPPFTPVQRERMQLFWQECVEQVVSGRRIILVAQQHQQQQQENEGEGDQQEAVPVIAGIVALATPEADTGPFRADVELLMVSPDHRRGGLGKKLLAAVEAAGRERGRTLLQLSTTAGSVAEQHLYPRLGYIKIGVVPNYGISPMDGQFVDGVYFYKDLTAIRMQRDTIYQQRNIIHGQEDLTRQLQAQIEKSSEEFHRESRETREELQKTKVELRQVREQPDIEVEKQ